MKRLSPRKLILFFLISVFLFSTLIYFIDWINYPIANEFFYEAIDQLYSKIYLLLIIFCFYKTNPYCYFLCLLLLPLHFVYMHSGIPYCCTTPFDYTFEIYALIKEWTNTGSIMDTFANCLYPIPIYGNFIMLIILFLPKTRKEYFIKKMPITAP